jgi:hypothetical protein
MALCISIGTGAYAAGLCCLAIGDNTKAIGAFQVQTCEPVTFPPVSAAKKEEVIASLQKLSDVYLAMGQQGHAPLKFVDEARYAIKYAIEKIKIAKVEVLQA